MSGKFSHMWSTCTLFFSTVFLVAVELIKLAISSACLEGSVNSVGLFVDGSVELAVLLNLLFHVLFLRCSCCFLCSGPSKLKILFGMGLHFMPPTFRGTVEFHVAYATFERRQVEIDF